MNKDYLIELRNPLEEEGQLHLQQSLGQLLSRNDFVDCTLCCQDGKVQAHRVILAVASTYIYNMLSSGPWPTPCSHPVLFFKTSTVEDMKTALRFIYTGNVHVSRSRIPKLMDIARDLECTYLAKAIEKAIQCFGVELFRQRIVKNPNSLSLKITPPANESNISGQDVGEANTNQEVEDNGFIPSSGTSPLSNASSQRDVSEYSVQNSIIKTEVEEEECIIEVDVDPSTLSSLSSVKSPKDVGSNSNAEMGRSLDSLFAADVRGNSNADTSSVTNSIKHNSNSVTSNGFCQQNNLNSYDDEHEEHTLMDDDELPISVVNLKSLAEPDTNTMKDSQFGEETDFLNCSTQGQPANCPWCFQLFTSASLLQKHIRVHVGTYKPYACPYCSTSFARSAHLKRHIRTHTGEKPFVCSICEKAFSRQDKLKIHLERHLQIQSQQTDSVSNAGNSNVGNSTQPLNFLKPNLPVSLKPSPSRKPVGGINRSVRPSFSLNSAEFDASRYLLQNSSEGEFSHFLLENTSGLDWQDHRTSSHLDGLANSSHSQILINNAFSITSQATPPSQESTSATSGVKCSVDVQDLV